MILAADPGLYGALALWDPETQALTISDLPFTEKKVRGAKALRKVQDEALMVAAVETFRFMGATVFVIERVGGMPGQSAPAAFNFGYGCGVLVTAARAAGLRIERVEPSVWKAALRVPRDKNAARARASDMMPTHAHLWPLKKHDGRAEAALLARYGERFL